VETKIKACGIVLSIRTIKEKSNENWLKSGQIKQYYKFSAAALGSFDSINADAIAAFGPLRLNKPVPTLITWVWHARLRSFKRWSLCGKVSFASAGGKMSSSLGICGK
jgi:hypothetical protein